MTLDEWDLMSMEFDRLLKEAGENGMTHHEFVERMTRLSWEWEELSKLEDKLRKGLDDGTKETTDPEND